MRVILLIGVNFVRSQWIALAVMAAYMAGIGGVFQWHVQRADVLFFLRWHSGYAVFLGTMIAIPALQAERKSRRILAVLSKGIHRWQYLGGILCGCAIISAIFCLLVGGIAGWLCRQGGLSPEGLGPLMLALFFCCVAAASVGLFCSIFLHPLFATAATSAILLLPFAMDAAGWKMPIGLFPVPAMVRTLMEFQFEPTGSDAGAIISGALLQIAVFWLAAAVIFARRDVTISPE
jgi:ABC-type transport system involved in multi-copper enzyme maturation permease subunit